MNYGCGMLLKAAAILYRACDSKSNLAGLQTAFDKHQKRQTSKMTNNGENSKTDHRKK